MSVAARFAMTPISLEDHAAMRLAGEEVECLCDEYASLILSQAKEIKRLKAEICMLENLFTMG